MAKLDDVRKVDEIHVGYAMVAKKVDGKRLKKDLSSELDCKMDDEEENDGDDDKEEKKESEKPLLSFKKTVQEIEKQGQSQTHATLPFHFLCLLHLANEKKLALGSNGLHDSSIAQDRS